MPSTNYPSSLLFAVYHSITAVHGMRFSWKMWFLILFPGYKMQQSYIEVVLYGVIIVNSLIYMIQLMYDVTIQFE